LKRYLSVLVASLFVLSSGIALAEYNGSTDEDCTYVGTITKIEKSPRAIVIKTAFEKTAKERKLILQDECQVQIQTTKNPADRGAFRKFADLKGGELVLVHGWPKDGKWLARKINIMNPDDYLMKRLADDAKAGVYYNHEP